MENKANPRARLDPQKNPFDILSDEVVITICVRTSITSHGCLRAVCPRLNELITLPAFRKERVDKGFAERGLIFAGGSRDGPTAECWLYVGRRWKKIAPMKNPHRFSCSAVIENELWVIGGYDADYGDYVDAVEAYSPETCRWRSLQPLSEGRSVSVCGVVGGRLIVAGGASIGGLQSVEEYTPTGWSPVPPLPYEAQMAAACVLNGKLYVAGGANSRRLQMFDGTAWQAKADLPARRSSAAAVVYEGKMMLIGGCAEVNVYDEDTALSDNEFEDSEVDNVCPTASVIIYDPQRDAWAEGVPLPRPTCGHRAAEYEGGIVVVGDGPPLHFDKGQWREIAGISNPRSVGRSGKGFSLGSVLLG